MEELTKLLGDPNIIRNITNFFYFIRDKRVLIIGAGGGGDVCGCLPTFKWIKQCGGEPILGSLTWERAAIYKNYGPRSFEQIDGLYDRIGTVAWGDRKTQIHDGEVRFQASRISEALDQPVVYLDISKGVRPLVQDLPLFCKQNNIFMVITLDVGGDILAQGTEKGLRSPLADAMTLAALAQTSLPKALGIYALNCDGELTIEELNQFLMEYNLKGWIYGQYKHTEEEFRFMESVIQLAGAITEASIQPLKYIHGERGYVTIRKDSRKVYLDEIVTHSFFLRLDEVYLRCPLANVVASSNSIEEANEMLLQKFNVISEYESEKRNFYKPIK